MHNGYMKRDVCDAYQVLLMHNVLSSVAAAGRTVPSGTVCYKDSAEQEGIANGNEEVEQTEEKYQNEKAECRAEFAVNSAALASASTPKQVCRIITGRRHGVDENNKENTNGAKKQLCVIKEASVGSSSKSSIFRSKIISKDIEEEVEQNGDESVSLQAFFKLCHIKNRRYFLVSNETQIPAVAFSHLPYSRERLIRSYSQNEDSNRQGVVPSEYATIRPINYKRIRELSFRDLLSTSAGSVSSEENSPVPSRKHFGVDDKGSDTTSPCALSRSHMLSRDRISGTVEEVPLLLRKSHGSSSSTNSIEYDPNLISNFDSDCGSRKTVMKFNGYVSTIMQYQPDNEVKRVVNDAFRSRFPHVHVSFSKINSIKRELHQIAVACNLEDCTTAHAYVFYEKVLLKGLVCKANRKLVAGAALLIAAKITDFGSMRIADVVNYLESSLRVNRKELLRYEIPLCAALSFDLKVPDSQLLPHYQRIALTIL